MKRALLVCVFSLFTFAAGAQDVVLGEFETKFATRGDSADRANNVEHAAYLIDGVVLQPGETFSYNEKIGPRTVARGFKEAHVIVEGVLTDGMGGGICQVSSTLHAAALMAGLRIDEHHIHSRSSLYIQPSFDATVDYGRFDFKFTNTYPFKILINTSVPKRGVLNVRILGAKKTLAVSIAVVLTNKHKPMSHVYHVKYLPAGVRKKIEPGTLGCDAERIRTIRDIATGVEITQVQKFRYKKTDKVTHVGKTAEERKFPLVDDHFGVGL